MYFKTTIIFLFCVLFTAVFSLDLCENHKNCDKCIADSNNCVWCAKDDWKGFRCKSIYEEDWCPNFRINPSNIVNKTYDRSFSSDLGKTVQIRPQGYKIKLRIGQQINFQFSYEAAKDYPVDIYFLVDASNSMEVIKKQTANQSKHIYYTLSNLTSNVFLGLGTFIDKNALPFTTSVDSKLTYSFKHHLSLTKSYENFKETLENVTMGQNYDEPEGGLEALAQVMVCKEEIGWRSQSRKIVVLLTDGSYHAAGDGKSAGIIKPYDGKCYTKNGVYLNDVIMDYPSVGIINKLARDEQITVVFAVSTTQQVVYKKLSTAIRDSWSTTYGNADMAEILKDIYEKITQKIKLEVKSAYRKKIEIKFDPDCLEEQGNECLVKKGMQTDFNGTIKLLDFVKEDNILVDVLIGGIKEKLTLDIDIINKCNCETTVNASICNYFGKRRCGVCECTPGRYGDECECTATGGTGAKGNSSCIAPGQSEVCSGQGFCHCGSCNCRDRYSGRYCECNQNMCPLDASGTTCSGHGNCVCGVCTCTSTDWTGEACECFKPKTPCVIDSKVCNNRGKCDCGACKCDPTSQWDARFFQDKFCRVMPCPDCHNRQCELLKSCGICHHSNRVNCTDCDAAIKVNVTQTLNDVDTTNSQWNVCHFEVNQICYSRYMYRYNDKDYSIELVVQTDVDCAESYYMFGGTFLLALILIGTATVVGWKLLMDARDRREYKQFKKQQLEDMSETRPNPCFKSPTMTFSNPAFRKGSIFRPN
ncbi:integrin beta-PS-like [Battus philenor]|uniref:integrin beta-PS-like n=1 Tax=Battus philenor TaxID=42288 RepID=UPI0035D11663